MTSTTWVGAFVILGALGACLSCIGALAWFDSDAVVRRILKRKGWPAIVPGQRWRLRGIYDLSLFVLPEALHRLSVDVERGIIMGERRRGNPRVGGILDDAR